MKMMLHMSLSKCTTVERLNCNFLTSRVLQNENYSSCFHFERNRGRKFIVNSSITVQDKTNQLRKLLEKPEIIQGPCCYDALSAKLIEAAGFSVGVMSGFSVSAARLGLPDTGLLSFGEMVDQTELISSAIGIPLIADADTGYGNAINVKRTVKGYHKAGASALIIEDQVWPKACGHTAGRQVVSRAEALSRIKAAVDAREELGGEILIVARSDSAQAISVEEAVWRSKAFADIGADLIFVDALNARSDMAALCKAIPNVPKMANILEGGKTPVLSPLELQNLGFKLVVYPLSLIGVSIRAMQDALISLKSGRLPPPSALPPFEEIMSIVGFPKYYEEEQRYSPSKFLNFEPSTRERNPPLDLRGDEIGSPLIEPSIEAGERQNEAPEPSKSVCVGDFECDDDPPFSAGELINSSSGGSNERDEGRIREVIQPFVLDAESSKKWEKAFQNDSRGWESSLPNQQKRMIRLKVTGKDGKVKIDVKVPAGFIDGLISTIPTVGGFDLRKMVEERGFDGPLNGEPIVDVSAKDGTGDRVQIFIE